MKKKSFDIQPIAYILIIPALLFIITFSFNPILRSFIYSFFDYNLNDQQKSGLYLKGHLNIDLYDETVEYLNFYLSSEMASATDKETVNKIEQIMDVLNAEYKQVINQYGSPGEVDKVPISSEEYKNISEFADEISNMIKDLYSSNDTGLILGDNVQAIASEFYTSLIPSNFIGFQNYIKALSDKRVWTALNHTFIFTIISVSLELIIGLGLALIMNKSFKGRGIVRTLSLLPWAVPTAVAALMWTYLFNGDSGILALLLAKLGIIDSAADLLLTGRSAMGAVIFADVWKTTPYMALLVLAGLQTIPNAVYEAGVIDGANKVQTFFRITLPLLKPSILVALLFRTLDAFRVFDLIYVLTGGGPGGATESISIYAYKVMFGQTKFGYGSTLTILLAICVCIISIIYIKVLDTNVN